MKASRLFAAWLSSTAAVTALACGGYHLYLSTATHRVLIVVDASFPMQEAWSRVPESLASVASNRRGSYALATDKGIVHGYRGAPDLGRTIPYGPRNLEALAERLPPQETKEADEIVLITNAGAAEAGKSGIRKVLFIGGQ